MSRFDTMVVVGLVASLSASLSACALAEQEPEAPAAESFAPAYPYPGTSVPAAFAGYFDAPAAGTPQGGFAWSAA